MTQAYEATLYYRCKARPAEHGYKGFLYVHRWSTGFQELIFQSADAADKFAARETAEGRPTTVQHGFRRWEAR